MATGTAEAGAASARLDPKAPLRTTTPPVFILGLVIVVLALVSGFASYSILTGLTPIRPTHQVVVTVLLINAVLVIAMIALIGWQVTGLWIARRRQAAGARLHVRIVGLFSIIAVLPAILLAIFASVSLDRGLDHWFSSRTKVIIQNSITVATAYLREHGQVIRSDVVGMAADIDEAVALVQARAGSIGKFLTAQSNIRSIPFAYLIDGQGKMLANANSLSDVPYSPPPPKAIELARPGKAVVIAPGSKSNKVGAIKRLDNFDDTYLFIIKTVNPQVLQHLRAARAKVAEYKQLKERRTGVQVAFGLMYVVIALTLLLAAIWIGLWFANRLVAPIRKLIGAAQQVSEGELNVQVTVRPGEGDLGQLGSTFNNMTSELRSQRNELVGANTMLDERRRFIEAVLSGVTAGVIGADDKGSITLANPSAEELLATPGDRLIGRPLEEAVSEFGPLLKRAQSQGAKPVHEQINLIRNAQERNFAVRVTTERGDEKDYGYVVTFDDITELVTAQRTSAWADIARRIAHEIKNPLTPIQLSAERIRRKYGDAITKDREIFEQCTETIIRQVGDIGRMVDEFSSFARMPKPVMEANDVGELVKEAVFLFQVSHPEIDIDVNLPDEPVITLCDRRLISQAVTNLVKNASEAIEAAAETAEGDYKGAISTRVEHKNGRYVIEVVDNGCGLPKENRNRLVEPYMTTREKGTGLGLAIVQKVTEQHGGMVQLRDAAKRNGKGGGACVRLDLPIAIPATEETPAKAGKSARKGGKTEDKQNELAVGSDEQGARHGV
ncbi:MAG: ATP-binding protein [Methyloligellaceae bacterium]